MTEDNWNTETNLYSIDLRTDRVGNVKRAEIRAECIEYRNLNDGTEHGDGCEAVYVYEVEDGTAELTGIDPDGDEHFRPIHLRAIGNVEYALLKQPGVDDLISANRTLGTEIERGE